MQGKGAPLPLQPIPKSNHNTKTKTKNNNKIKVVYTENLTDPLVLEIFHNSLRLRRGHQDSRTQTPNRSSSVGRLSGSSHAPRRSARQFSNCSCQFKRMGAHLETGARHSQVKR